MFNANWEIVFTLEKINGSAEKAKSEFQYDMNDNEIILFLRRRTKELVDQYDFKTVEGRAIQIEGVDKNSGLVYYSTPPVIHTYKHENEQ